MDKQTAEPKPQVLTPPSEQLNNVLSSRRVIPLRVDHPPSRPPKLYPSPYLHEKPTPPLAATFKKPVTNGLTSGEVHLSGPKHEQQSDLRAKPENRW
ncbi:hypothetical protein V6N12_007104 [Hibiscus sabdariffa]|uniref:Uncharacterized protein n=1 Tax=Hibiscus sabdariffa TaxID=183260 RepID=A0ABR2F0S6_9ROSI